MKKSESRLLTALIAVKGLCDSKTQFHMGNVEKMFTVSNGIGKAMKELKILSEDGKQWIGGEPNLEMCHAVRAKIYEKSVLPTVNKHIVAPIEITEWKRGVNEKLDDILKMVKYLHDQLSTPAKKEDPKKWYRL